MALENKNFSVKNGLSIINTEVISVDRKTKNLTFDTADTNTLKINGNTLIANSGAATVTLPNTSTTLVGRNTSDTLSNKTLGNFVSTGKMELPPGPGVVLPPGQDYTPGSFGQILKSTGTGMYWADTFNGIPRYIPYDSNFTAESQGLYLVDTSDNTVEIILPNTTTLAIEDGEAIEFVDAKGTWGINFVYLYPGNPNDRFINSANIEDNEYIFDSSNAIVRVVWDGQYWRVFPR
jgi:hypothetical protein